MISDILGFSMEATVSNGGGAIAAGGAADGVNGAFGLDITSGGCPLGALRHGSPHKSTNLTAAVRLAVEHN